MAGRPPLRQFAATVLIPLALAALAALAALGGIAYAQRSTSGSHARLVVTATHVVSTVIAGIALEHVAANPDAATWREATRPGVMPGVLAAGVLVGPLVLLARGRTRARHRRARRHASPFGWMPWPRIDVPLDRIERIEVVEPRDYGGLGYRMIARQRAVVLRPGEALRVTRRNRPDVLVTVRGAGVAAGVLLAHKDRATRP